MSEQQTPEQEAALTPRILERLQSCEPGAGLTANELAAALGASVISVRARCTELKDASKIRKTEERRKGNCGRFSRVFVAEQAGRQQ